MENLVVDGGVILKWMLKVEGVTRLIWCVVQSDGELL